MSGPFTIRRDDEALDKLIHTDQLQPLLSNAKWVKLLGLLVQIWPSVHACRVKLIWEAANVDRTLLFDEDTSYAFDYYANAMESMVSGRPRLGGWVAYKEIEWVDFPRFPAGGEPQDLGQLQQQLAQIGQFRVEESADNLRLYAYLRP
ncbi:hypothetical protein [Hymenobacter lapidiphilus]|uniref:Uncharacterized protein n=1 Tax=Hymenobacter lapidiphilus TaxID=2608003 RepID=A0A7Y7PTH8_9BACT|nr:hypothetical protein [Hymenobacter lapidiphilus]NVO33392.1 hypothetical protein [Hymenobacter lapidiphilus]